jgi:hypothetical protein
MIIKALHLLLLAAALVVLPGCVRETPPPPKSAGVIYQFEASESPDHRWSVAKVKRAPVTIASGRRVARGPNIALIANATGKRVFDFSYFYPRLDGTRAYFLEGAFARPPQWSPDSSKLAFAFHNRHSKDLYVLRQAKSGWREVHLPPHDLARDLRKLPALRWRELRWNTEQVDKIKWTGSDELQATYSVWVPQSPAVGAAASYAYTFQGGRVSSRLLRSWVEPDYAGQ